MNSPPAFRVLMTFKSLYGVLEVGPSRWTHDGHWMREERYTSDRVYGEESMSASEHDMSPRHEMGIVPRLGSLGVGSYDGKCSCCYLGITHTDDLHNERVSGK